MIFKSKTVTLKNGSDVIFRSPADDEAEKMLDYLKTCAGETEFILRYPEECSIDATQEQQYLASINESDTGMMIVCEIDGEIAGNCQLALNKRMKTRHRASVAIAIVKKYWGLGIGTAMFAELIAQAKQCGVEQLELEYIEGNERARGLYEKTGFVIVAEKPDAIRLKSGKSLREFFMVKRLDI